VGAVEHQDCRLLEELHLLLPHPCGEVAALAVDASAPPQFPVNEDGDGGLVVVDEESGVVIADAEDFGREDQLGQGGSTLRRSSSESRRKCG
jgi:hypothetical protein